MQVGRMYFFSVQVKGLISLMGRRTLYPKQPSVVVRSSCILERTVYSLLGVYRGQTAPCVKPNLPRFERHHIVIRESKIPHSLVNGCTVVEMRCYAAVQRDLSDLQRFVPREPGETRNYRSEVGGLSDSQVCPRRIALRVAGGVLHCATVRFRGNFQPAKIIRINSKCGEVIRPFSCQP